MAPGKANPEKKKGTTTKDVTPQIGVKKTKRVPRGSKRDWSQYSHNLPDRTDVAKNGRQTGRNLIAWTHPGSSGEAITQRLMRMRKELIAEGHLVPPYPQKPGGPVEDMAVRGLVRANPERVDDAYTTRKVSWTEPIDHLKKPLGNAVYALQSPNNNEGNNNEDESDEDEDVNYLAQRSSSRLRSSGSGNLESFKGKILARPALSTRPARSTAKKVSYAEDEEDILDGGSVMESKSEDGESDGDEQKAKGLKAHKRSRSSSSASNIRHDGRSQSREPSVRESDINVGVQAAFAEHPFVGPTPGARGLGTNHMSPYSMAPHGVHWYHGPMGLPMLPFGMGLDMMSGFNTTPTRSSAFTTNATSPADFDIETASPRSAAFFQAHLNEYNSPTPRGYADFNPMVPIPMGLCPSNASVTPGTMPDRGMALDSERNAMLTGDGDGNRDEDANKPQKRSDAEFSSTFLNAEAVAKRLKKTNERK
ncbi:hypothetical protein N0V82_009370 [Gnomoniopsis sp. IMI 355080]|nr:hypothetical protein N0V82_009370 [Gnomoniopsis sp. IMI 355080]